MFRYKLNYSVDLSAALPKIQTLFNELNEHMKAFGFDEKLIEARSNYFSIEIGFSRLLTEDEQDEIVEIITKSYQTELSQYKIKFENIEIV